MMRILLLAFTFTFLFSGCSQQKQKTPLKVSIGAAAGSSVWTGGLIIYGSNNFGKKFVKELAANDELLIELPNGIWKFGAIGWVGSAKLEGTAYCDYKSNINLQGEQIDLTMVASKSKCNNPVFGGNHDETSGFTQLEFNSCSGIKSAIAAGQASEYSSSFVCDGDDNPFAGDSKSYKLVIPQNVFDAAGMIKPDGQTISKCYDDNDATDYTAKRLSDIRVPAGTLQNSIPYSVIAYTGTGCTGNSKLYLFINGLTQPAQFDQGFGAIETSPLSTRVFLHTDFCSAEQKDKSPFAVSHVNASYEKHLICTADQLKNIACTSCPGGGSDPASDAIYVLGADIDLKGISADGTPTKTYIKNTFKGSFDGKGHTISNGNYPLFNEIQNDNNERSVIRNITLSKFNLNDIDNTSAGSSIGIFANKVTSNGYKPIEISDIKISSDSSITVDDTSAGNFAGHFGGLIGEISHSSAGSERVRILHNEQLADVSSSNSSSNTGGLVGKILITSSGSFEASNVIIESNAVGKSFANLAASSYISISAHSNIGGIVGYTKNAKIERNIVSTQITNPTSGSDFKNIGGIIGECEHDGTYNETFVNHNISDMSYTPQNNTDYIGGVIGIVNLENYSNDKVSLDSNISSLIVGNTPNVLNYVGGAVGEVKTTASAKANFQISNSKAHLEIQSQGLNIGGFIGEFLNNVAPATSDPSHIDRSIVTGHIKENSSHSSNTLRSGMIGYAKNAKVTMSVSNMDIEAYDIAGGFAAQSTLSEFFNNYGDFNIDISHDGSSTPVIVGGAIGESAFVMSSSAYTYFEGNLVIADITTPSNITSCYMDGTGTPPVVEAYCGKLFGIADYIHPSAGYTFNISSLNTDGSNINANIANVGIVNTNNNDIALNSLICGRVLDNSGNDGSCDPSGGLSALLPYLDADALTFTPGGITISSDCNSDYELNWDDDDNLCEPTFYYQWKKYGQTTSGDLLAGNALEPLEIGTVAEWNAIQDDEFLMNKSFMLTADLDFHPSGSSPIDLHTIGLSSDATTHSPFTGTFIPNGYKLKNIDTDFDASDKYAGVFAHTQNARIGDYNDPLVIEDFEADFTGGGSSFGAGGIIGKAEDSDLFIQVKSAEITDSSGVLEGIGGIVGLAVGDVSINNSSFEGKINADNTDNAGGVVAQVDSSSSLKIQSSYVDLSLFKGSGSSEGGGFVGTVDSTSTLNIDTSYLKFSLLAATDFYVITFGGVVGNNAGSTSIENSFVDFSNLDDFHNDEKVGAGTGTVSNTDFGAVGSYDDTTPGLSATLTTNLEQDTQYNLHTANPAIFSIGGGEDWKLDNCNNLRLFWEYIDPNQSCQQPL